MNFKRIIVIIGLIIIALAIIAGLFILFFNSFLQTEKFRANETAKLSECVKDTDCAKVQTTCCSCNMGGTENCVSLAMENVYKQNLQACPKPEKIICAAFYNCNVQSCGCVNGTCVGKK